MASSTPQVHFIGEIKGGKGFDYNCLYCKWNFRCGMEWRLLSGKESGETYEEDKAETEKYTVWDHPIDLHFACRSIRGWPRLFVEVWGKDSSGRDSLGGYAIGTLPMHPGLQDAVPHAEYISGIAVQRHFIFLCREVWTGDRSYWGSESAGGHNSKGFPATWLRELNNCFCIIH